MSYLTLGDLTKSYDGQRRVVDKVSLDVEKGEFVTLLGPSGSGKTTTLMMISGFEDPDSGSISVGGRSVVSQRPYERNMGVMFQSYALFPHMSVVDNIAFPLKMRRFSRSERARKVGRILDIVGLAQFSTRLPRELSGGQQQRVALARALVFEPDVLLLDEPLGALDKNLREQMQIEIKRVQREFGITAIYVTHDQTEAMTMSDRIAVFNHGVIQQVDVPDRIYNQPTNRFVGEFIGDSNFLTARLVDQGGGVSYINDKVGVVRKGETASEKANGSSVVDLLIRPECIRLTEQPWGNSTNCVPIKIESVLRYGESILASGIAKGARLRARIPGRPQEWIVEGAELYACWLDSDVHVVPAS